MLLVAPPAPALALSSLAVVKRTEPVSEGALESRDPLRNGTSRIVPFVGEPTFAAGETVSLFLVAYPGAGGAAERPGLTLEFSRDGARRRPLDRRAARAGRRRAASPTWRACPRRASRRAATRWPPRCSQGDAAARERAFFTVAPPPAN